MINHILNKFKQYLIRNKKVFSNQSFFLRLSCVFLIFLFTQITIAHSAEIQEQQVKAAFLYNFSRFVTWPDRGSPDSQNPVQYCILGTNQVDQLLESTVAGKRDKRKIIDLKRLNNLSEIDGCELVYIADNSNIPLQDIFTAVKDRAIVTVSNMADFAENGGMISLSQKNKRIHVTINIDVVKESNLKISSKVKRLSTIIKNR